MQNMYYIGLYVHKRTISYCVKDGSGAIHAGCPIPAPLFHARVGNLTLTFRSFNDLRFHLNAGCATLYDGVGSVKRHVEFTSREGLVFSSPKGDASLSCISTKARFVNPAVESGSTNHLFDHPEGES